MRALGPGFKKERSYYGESRNYGRGTGVSYLRAVQGRGYAFEACSAILGYAEEELGLRHVRIKTGEGNEASVRLAEALGFSRTEDTGRRVRDSYV